jgi:hypothetical protein
LAVVDSVNEHAAKQLRLIARLVFGTRAMACCTSTTLRDLPILLAEALCDTRASCVLFDAGAPRAQHCSTMKSRLDGHSSILLLASMLTSSACSDSITCTFDQKLAITVQVQYTQGLEPDLVTAAQSARPQECWNTDEFARDAGGSASGVPSVNTYHCHEQGGGEYVVRVVSGNLSWTQSVDIAANQCHTTEHKELRFVLDPSDAD